jgi:hypothetical protein
MDEEALQEAIDDLFHTVFVRWDVTPIHQLDMTEWESYGSTLSDTPPEQDVSFVPLDLDWPLNVTSDVGVS